MRVLGAIIMVLLTSACADQGPVQYADADISDIGGIRPYVPPYIKSQGCLGRITGQEIREC